MAPFSSTRNVQAISGCTTALLLPFLLTVQPTSAKADCHIAPSNLVPNRTGSQCVWVTLESIARHWGMTDLYNLHNNLGTSGPGEVARVMIARHRHIYWSPEGKQDWQSLANASANHWPVGVGLRGTHMLLLVDLTQTHATIIDNGGQKSGQRQVWTREYFASAWDGWFVTLDPEQK